MSRPSETDLREERLEKNLREELSERQEELRLNVISIERILELGTVIPDNTAKILAREHSCATRQLNVILAEVQNQASEEELTKLESIAKFLEEVRIQIGDLGDQYSCGDLTIAQGLLDSFGMNKEENVVEKKA